MTQVPGSNSAGQVFTDFNLNSAPAEASIDRIGQKAVDTGNKLEKDVGQKGAQGIQQVSSKALGAAAALGAVLASVERVLNAIEQARGASAAWADTFRDIDAGLAPIIGQLGDQGELYDRLRKQAAEFGTERIRQLEAERGAMDAMSIAQRAMLNLMGSSGDERINAQISQIESRRKQLEEAIRQSEVDRGIAALEREAENIRRSKLTADEKRVEDLMAKIEDAKRLASLSPQAQQADALGQLTKTFEAEIAAIVGRAGKELGAAAGNEFIKTVQDQFAGVFDQGGLREYGVSLQSQLTAIESQLRSVGSLGGG